MADRVIKGDFRNADLSNQDMSNAIIIADFTNADLRGCDFRKSMFKEIAVSLTCRTFDRVKVDRKTFFMLLALINKLDVDGDDLYPKHQKKLSHDLYMGNIKTVQDLIESAIPPDELDEIEKWFERLDYSPD